MHQSQVSFLLKILSPNNSLYSEKEWNPILIKKALNVAVLSTASMYSSIYWYLLSKFWTISGFTLSQSFNLLSISACNCSLINLSSTE